MGSPPSGIMAVPAGHLTGCRSRPPGAFSRPDLSLTMPRAFAMTSRTVLIDRHPGRSSQSIGVARALGTDIDLIHEPSVHVAGTKGDSQCYLGVMSKVDAIH